MLSIRLEPKMEEQLKQLAIVTKRPKSFFVREALENYLEDMVDYYEAQKRASDPKRNLISVEELEKALDLH